MRSPGPRRRSRFRMTASPMRAIACRRRHFSYSARIQIAGLVGPRYSVPARFTRPAGRALIAFQRITSPPRPPQLARAPTIHAPGWRQEIVLRVGDDVDDHRKAPRFDRAERDRLRCNFPRSGRRDPIASAPEWSRRCAPPPLRFGPSGDNSSASARSCRYGEQRELPAESTKLAEPRARPRS